MAVLSLVLGILAVLFCWFPILGAALAITALVISIVVLCRRDSDIDKLAFKMVGLILSIIATVVAVFMTIALATGVTFVANLVEDIFGSNLGYFISYDTKKLAEHLLTENTIIRMEIATETGKKHSKEDIKERYMNVLIERHPELYEAGYTIEVEDNFMFRIVEPKRK